MKKILALCLLVMIVSTAQAQMRWWLGGSLAASTTDSRLKDGDNSTSYNILTLAPTVGLEFNDQWTVAVALEYLRSSQKDFDTYNKWGVAPKIRYSWAEYKDLRFFAEASAGWYTDSFKNGVNDGHEFNLSLRPGLAYTISDRVVLYSDLGGLSWKTASIGGEGNRSTFNLDLTSYLSLGFYVYL